MSGIFHPHPHPPTPPVPPAPKYVRVSVWEPSGGGATGPISGSLAFDDAGWPLVESDMDGTRLRFTLPRDAQYGWHATLYVVVRGGSTFRFDIAVAPDVDVVLPAILVALPRLVPEGHVFRTEQGDRWTGIGCSDFHLFGRFLNGDDLTPILKDRAGFNLLRVWTRYDLSQYGIGTCTLAQHPDLYERIPEFLSLCASKGFYIELTAYTGREDFSPTHWRQLGDAVRDSSNVLVELINEADQTGNAIDLKPFNPLPFVLCSHGSNGSQKAPVGFVFHHRPTPEDPNAGVWLPDQAWHFADFHTNGAYQEPRKIGHNAWEWWSGPTLTSETSRCPDVGMWTGVTLEQASQRAFDSAAGGVLLSAGAGVFHSVSGKLSRIFGDFERVCANAWIAGAKSVDLQFQDGAYVHHGELEAPNAGETGERWYGRRLPDGREGLVHIRP